MNKIGVVIATFKFKNTKKSKRLAVDPYIRLTFAVFTYFMFAPSYRRNIFEGYDSIII